MRLVPSRPSRQSTATGGTEPKTERRISAKARSTNAPRGTADRSTDRGSDGRRQGQSLVEFSLVLGPLLLVLLGIIQFGFIFNSYVTLTNAVREGAREGTIYVYDKSLGTKSANDLARNETIRSSILSSLNLLRTSAPQFTTTSTWTSTSSGSTTTYTNGDLQVAYTLPSGGTDSDPRTAQQLTVTATYHQDLIIPLIGNLLPKDSGGRLGLGAQVTMVIN